MDFSAIEQRYGLPPGYLSRVRAIESSDGRDVYNKQSGAAGDFQFIPRTARAYGLSDPYDTMAAAEAAARLAADNRAALARGGVADPTGAHLYLAHQQGAQGALRLLNSQAPAAASVGQNAVAWNAGDPNQTGASFADRVMALYDKRPATFAERWAGAPAAVAPDAADTPAAAYSARDQLGLLATIGGLLGDSSWPKKEQEEIAPLRAAPMQRPNYIPLPVLGLMR